MNTTVGNFKRDMRRTGVEAYNSLPVNFGDIQALVFGGPFHEYVPGQRRLVSVKLAQECEIPANITVPSEDFGTPTHAAMHVGVRRAIEAVLAGNDLYAGCGAGIGRTGTFMACLVKVMFDYAAAEATSDLEVSHDPVLYVRKHYLGHAVETSGQRKFIQEFATANHVTWLSKKLNPTPIEVTRVQSVDRVVYTFNPYFAFLQLFDKLK